MADLELRFGPASGAEQTLLVNGVDATTAIRTAEVTASVSAVAALPGACCPDAAAAAIGPTGGLVAEGRDIGTAVFPDAELKIYLTATVGAGMAARG